MLRTLSDVAVRTKKLKVRFVVRPAKSQRNNVVNVILVQLNPADNAQTLLQGHQPLYLADPGGPDLRASLPRPTG